MATVWMRTATRVAGVTAAGAVALGTAYAAPAVSTDPAFNPSSTRFPQDVYSGRLRTILALIDPRSLLTSDAELERCQGLLRTFDEGKRSSATTDAELWDAKATVSAIIHPVTGERMLIFGRMSSFLLMNVPVAVGMLSASTPMANIFWQWVNQSYNVVNNYTCRAGATVEWTPLLQSYSLAVAVSCGLSVAGGRLMASVPAAAALGPFVPYLAVIAAGSCNVAFTRMDEIKNGVHVFDEEGSDLGVSIAAGKQAVFKTVTTRSMFLPIFPLLIPPVVMKALKGAGVKGRAAMVAEVSVIALSLALGLPAALAILPQRMTLPVDSLEPQFSGRTLSNGQPVTEVFANKGL